MTILNAGILDTIGRTPMVALEIEGCRFMAKLEYANLFGSMKDRAARNVILTLLNQGTIDMSTTIIESSSGNFAIALSAVCSILGLKCICVVDSFLTKVNQCIIEQYGANLVWIDQPNTNQSYQEKRIETVQKIMGTQENVHWTNQYDNVLMQEAYFPLAEEILCQHPQTEYIFVPVSTCGTVAGISTWTKRYASHVKVIAVDTCGSKIFKCGDGDSLFPGMGSGFKPGNLRNANISDFVIISDYECATNCWLLVKQGVFAGASSGCVVAAIRKVAADNKNVVAIFPDRGDRYLDNLYNDKWCKKYLSELFK